MTAFPLTYLGNGRFETTPYHLKRLDYGQGEIITVEEVQERSLKSHNHFFAQVYDHWLTLPEGMKDEFPSSEHLRKRALIEAGYCTETRIAFKNNSEAIAAAAFIKELDGFAYCAVSENIVIARRAESQSIRAMKKERFQKSKDDVLRVISELLGADVAKEAA